MRIVVAMSGGVDSSVAAALLAEQGHDVIGVSMQLYDNSQTTDSGQRAFGTCCTIDDLYDARRVAATIGIPPSSLRVDSATSANFVREYVMAGRRFPARTATAT
jgi:tRNA-specific 2-thiouridylase